MHRVERVRAIVDDIFAGREDSRHERDESIHLYGVSLLCVQLALKRGLNPTIAAAAGMLHDIYRLRTGLNENHAHNSEEDSRTLLRDLGLFAPDEQVTIRKAIFRHSNKSVEHEPYDEVLKDADVLQRYLHNTNEPTKSAAYRRLKRVAAEFGIARPERVRATKSLAVREWAGRSSLADIAEELARRSIVGDANKSGPDVYPLIRYFPGASLSQGFDWCASFVYHCCWQVGLRLPIRYPGVALRFAAVPAWLEWANRPETQFFHAGRDGFMPERGDLVVFNQLVSDVEHDHIGVVLGHHNGVLTTAEGNVENRAGVFQRDAGRNIYGYVRINDVYSYNADAMEPSHIK